MSSIAKQVTPKRENQDHKKGFGRHRKSPRLLEKVSKGKENGNSSNIYNKNPTDGGNEAEFMENKPKNSVVNKLVANLLLPYKNQVEKALDSLLNLECYHEQIRNEFKQTNICKNLVAAMKSGKNSERLQWKAFQLISDLTSAGDVYMTSCGSPHFIFDFGKAGAAKAIIKAMEKFLNAPKVQISGMYALVDLSCGSDENLENVVAAGAIAAAIKAIKNHSKNSGFVAESLIACLRAFSDRENKSVGARLLQEGAVEAAVEYAYPEEGIGIYGGITGNSFSGIQNESCRLLLNLRVSNRIAFLEKMKESDAVKALVDGLFGEQNDDRSSGYGEENSQLPRQTDLLAMIDRESGVDAHLYACSRPFVDLVSE